MWHHEHHFNNIDENNTMMIDIVHYKLHFGILGTVVNNLIV
jgi:ligand-binding SRPBCC domain-containing protein